MLLPQSGQANLASSDTVQFHGHKIPHNPDLLFLPLFCIWPGYFSPAGQFCEIL